MMTDKQFKAQLKEAAQLAHDGELTDTQMSAMGAVEALSFLNSAMHTISCEMVPALQVGDQDGFLQHVSTLIGLITQQAMKLSSNAERMADREGAELGIVHDPLRVAIDKLDSHIQQLLDASEEEDSVVSVKAVPRSSKRAMRAPGSEVVN